MRLLTKDNHGFVNGWSCSSNRLKVSRRLHRITKSKHLNRRSWLDLNFAKSFRIVPTPHPHSPPMIPLGIRRAQHKNNTTERPCSLHRNLLALALFDARNKLPPEVAKC